MTVQEKETSLWLKKLGQVIEAMPDGIEAHIGYRTISAYKSGRLVRHMKVNDGFGISDGSEIGVIHTPSSFIPYSEGS